jgi:hypothetical protein
MSQMCLLAVIGSGLTLTAGIGSPLIDPSCGWLNR